MTTRALYHHRALFLGAVSLVVLMGGCDAAFAISVESLRAPMGELKSEVFSWLFAVKIAAVAVGSTFAVVKQSITPFGVGAAIGMGIHFFDKHIGDAAGALIG